VGYVAAVNCDLGVYPPTQAVYLLFNRELVSVLGYVNHKPSKFKKRKLSQTLM